MRRNRPALFKGRHFEAEIIVLCVRWYLRFGLSLRNLEEIMAERNLRVDGSGANSADGGPAATMATWLLACRLRSCSKACTSIMKSSSCASGGISAIN